MMSRVALQVAAVLLGSVVSVTSQAAVDLADLEAECVLDLGGEFLGETCEVTTVVETPFTQLVKPSGKSGLGWSAIGVIIETTVDTSVIEESTSNFSEFVAGDMSLPGCQASQGQPKKCFDHYVTKTLTVYSWLLESSDTTTAVVVTGCLNPGGQNMGMHKHCAI